MATKLGFLLKGYALALCVMCFAFTFPAMAMELTPAVDPQNVPVFDLLAALVGGDSAAQWITLIGFAAWIITQLIAWVPAEWVAKLPTWLIKVLKVLAGNYRKAANEITNDPERIRQLTKPNS
jgi:hypothetical protein